MASIAFPIELPIKTSVTHLGERSGINQATPNIPRSKLIGDLFNNMSSS